MIEIPADILDNFEARCCKYGMSYHKLSNVEYSLTKDNDLSYVDREIVHRQDSAAGLFRCKDFVLMSRQFRAAIFERTKDIDRSFIYEVVAGCIDKDEAPLNTLYRELKEETGIGVDFGDVERVELVHSGFVSPGYSTEYQYLYLVDLNKTPEPHSIGLKDEGELIFSKWLLMEDVLSLMQQGLILDGKTQLLINKGCIG